MNTITITIGLLILGFLAKLLQTGISEFVNTAEQYYNPIICKNRQAILEFDYIIGILRKNKYTSNFDDIYNQLCILKDYADIVNALQPIAELETSKNLTAFYTTYDSVINDLKGEKWKEIYYLDYISAVKNELIVAAIFLKCELEGENKKYYNLQRLLNAIKYVMTILSKIKNLY